MPTLKIGPKNFTYSDSETKNIEGKPLYVYKIPRISKEIIEDLAELYHNNTRIVAIDEGTVIDGYIKTILYEKSGNLYNLNLGLTNFK